MASIKCITFDLDDTLWDCHPVILRAENRFYHWIEQHYPAVSADLDLETLGQHKQQFFSRFPRMQHDFTWLRKQWLAHLAGQYQLPAEFIEKGFQVFWEARNQVTLFEGVVPMLLHMKQHYRVASITNGNADIHQTGLAGCFHHSIAAATVGAAKPSPVIFEKALSLTRVKPEEAIHVGDDPVRDIQGASAIGMRTVWVNLSNRTWHGPAKPDREISHIAQLPCIVKEMDRRRPLD